MKQKALSLLFGGFLLLLAPQAVFAADAKITELPADATPTADDLLITVDDPAGTPANKKATIANVVKGGLPTTCTEAQLLQWDDVGGNWVCGDASATDHGALTGLDDNDHAAVYCLFTVSNVDPGAGAVNSACHFWINDAVTPKRIFYGEGVGANFEDFAALGDAYNGIHVGSSGTADASASGSEDKREVKALDLPTFMEAFNGTTAFANHPSNDGIEYVSSEAADTTQIITAYCTINGGDQSLTFLETATLNGVTQVSTTRTDWDKCYAFKLSATATGTVTIREASGNATIATIAPGATKVADLDTVFHRQDYLSITLNIDRDTALVDGDDRGDFWVNTLGRTLTITQIKGWTDTGTSTINILRDDGSATDICTSDLVASTSGVTCTLDATEKLISDGHKLDFDMVQAATSGTPTKVTVNIKAY